MSLLILLLNLVAVKATVPDQYQLYLAKIINKPKQSKNFSELDLAQNQQLKGWLEHADLQLDTSKLATYKGYFKISIDHRGFIDGLEAIELDEQDFTKFKNFISSILSVNFKKLHEDYAGSYFFDLDADLLYLDRSFNKIESPNFAKSNDDNIELLSSLTNESLIKANLLSPDLVDYPALGEELVFELNLKNKKSILKLKVIDTDKKTIKLAFDRLLRDQKEYFGNMVFEVERPQKSSRDSLTEVVAAATSAAAHAGFEGSVLSYGILPGALAVLSMGDTWVKNRVILNSFNLSRGDEVKLKTKGG